MVECRGNKILENDSSSLEHNFTHLIRDAVLRGERPAIIESDSIDAPHEFIKLMKVCWDTDPKVRPMFDEIFVELKEIASTDVPVEVERDSINN